MKLWVENLRNNRELFRKTGWVTQALQGKEKGKTAIICGASPAINKQITTLQEIQYDKDFVVCGLTSNLEYLLKNEIYPKYVMTMDGHPSQGEFFDTIDMEKTKNIVLIANLYAYPPMLKKWKGPLYFIRLQTGDKKFDRYHDKWYGPANGTGDGFFSIMASFSIMTAAAFLILECPIILFVGNELSFQDAESTYYVDREDPRDNDPRGPHGDIYGNKVYTNLSLLAVKYSLEGFLEVISGGGWFINCTEAGIFGISKKYENYHLPWIKQLRLKNGIAQARQIMRTGQPFYA
ncbi:MAG: 6-hydroxymethylpterin diphosphokinase MptE-like protein [Planctomycetota bacterium]